jgi:hypothetical protein
VFVVLCLFEYAFFLLLLIPARVSFVAIASLHFFLKDTWKNANRTLFGRCPCRYETGRGGKLPRDTALAAAYFSLAAELGDRDARRTLDARWPSRLAPNLSCICHLARSLAFPFRRYAACAKVRSALGPASPAGGSAAGNEGRDRVKSKPSGDEEADEDGGDADALEASWQIAAAIELADAANHLANHLANPASDHDYPTTTSSSSSSSSGEGSGSPHAAAADRSSFAASLLAPRAAAPWAKKLAAPAPAQATAAGDKGKKDNGKALGWFSSKPPGGRRVNN